MISANQKNNLTVYKQTLLFESVSSLPPSYSGP
jgi:hypothetical protein